MAKSSPVVMLPEYTFWQRNLNPAVANVISEIMAWPQSMQGKQPGLFDDRLGMPATRGPCRGWEESKKGRGGQIRMWQGGSGLGRHLSNPQPLPGHDPPSQVHTD